ncbi:MAG: hypothetical protein Q4D81_06750 [Eubacteriales bacterium]|nr:hypothetical protein [Eubacteriales bacterium]
MIADKAFGPLEQAAFLMEGICGRHGIFVPLAAGGFPHLPLRKHAEVSLRALLSREPLCRRWDSNPAGTSRSALPGTAVLRQLERI